MSSSGPTGTPSVAPGDTTQMNFHLGRFARVHVQESAQEF